MVCHRNINCVPQSQHADAGEPEGGTTIKYNAADITVAKYLLNLFVKFALRVACISIYQEKDFYSCFCVGYSQTYLKNQVRAWIGSFPV